MGSTCSIVNNTEFDVWIYDGVNYQCLIPVVGGVLAVLTAGVGLAALGASVGVGGALLGGGALIVAEEGIIMGTTAWTIAGLTAGTWTMVGIVGGVSSTVLATILGISAEDAAKIQNYVKDFQSYSKKVSPGGSYEWNGSLSVNKRVYVMNDMLQTDDRACFTGPTANSTNVYKISEYFKRLDIKKTKYSTITVPAK